MGDECVYSACICCYSSCKKPPGLIGCKGKGELLCLSEECCCAAGEAKHPIGVVKEGIFGLGLPCCKCVIKKPEVLILSEGECLCFNQAAAFPFAGKVPGPICAFCCIQCIPNAGIMKPPGGGGAPPNAEMNR